MLSYEAFKIQKYMISLLTFNREQKCNVIDSFFPCIQVEVAVKIAGATEQETIPVTGQGP